MCGCENKAYDINGALSNLYMDGCVREVRATLGVTNAKMKVRGIEQSLEAGLCVENNFYWLKLQGYCRGLWMKWTVCVLIIT